MCDKYKTKNEYVVIIEHMVSAFQYWYSILVYVRERHDK